MTENDDFQKEFVRRPNARGKMQAGSPKQEHNHPVSVEEFDREHLGVAAKE